MGYAIHRKTVLVAILVLFFGYSNAQGTWKRLDVPATGMLSTVCFTDSLYGWIAGDSGVIIHTADGGLNWVVQESNTANDIVDIFFLDRQRGWASSYNYAAPPYGTLLLKTLDGGMTWVPEIFPEEDIFITCILYSDELNGWMGGRPHALLKTSDGGLSWTHAAVDTTTLAFFPVLGIKFWNEQYGYACGGIFDVAGVIWRTSDGGNLWHAMDVAYAPADEVHALHLFDSVTVMGAGGDPDFGYGVGMIRSSDGGMTWSYDELEIQGYASDLGFRTEKECWAPLGPRKMMVFSSDTGKTWTGIPTPDSTAIFRLTFSDSLHGYAAGAEGAVLKFVPLDGLSSDPLDNDGRPLIANYPNPFGSTTEIRFTVPPSMKKRHVVITVSSILGEMVRTITDREYLPGEHRVAFDASGLPEGIWICRMTMSGDDSVNVRSAVQKMVRVR